MVRFVTYECVKERATADDKPSDEEKTINVGPVYDIPILDPEDPRYIFEEKRHKRDAAVADSLHTPQELQAGLQHSEPGVRWRVVDRLVARGRDDPDTIPALLDALKDPDPAVRSAVAAVLAEFDSPAVRPALLRMLDDDDEDVRDAAVYSIEQLG